MNKIYLLCEFDYGGTGQFYQEIESGTLLRLCSLDGTDLVTEGDYGYYVVNEEQLINLFQQ